MKESILNHNSISKRHFYPEYAEFKNPFFVKSENKEYPNYRLSTADKPFLVGMLNHVEKIITSTEVPIEEIILFGRS